MKIKMDITVLFFTFWNIIPYDYLICSLSNVHVIMFLSPELRMVPFFMGWEGLDL